MKTFKQFLAEDPDYSRSIRKRELSPWMPNTYTFTLLGDTGCALYGETVVITHDSIRDYIVASAEDDIPKRLQDRVKLLGDLTVIDKFCKEAGDLFKRDEREGHLRNSRAAFGLSGRIWMHHETVAFWRYPVTSIKPKELETVEKIISALGKNIESFHFDTSEPDREDIKLIDYDTLTKSKKVSQQKMDMSKAHIMDPIVKNLLKNITSDMSLSTLQKKADQMGISLAQLKAQLSAE